MGTPRRWLVVEVAAPSEQQAAALAEELVAAGAGAVQEEGGAVRTWLPDPGAEGDATETDLDATPRPLALATGAVRAYLAPLAAALDGAVDAGLDPALDGADEVDHRAPSSTLRWWWQAEEDWAALWRRGLGPRRAGRVVVTPTWAAPERAADDVLVRIDPKMAFGTGEHATTRGVLRLLQSARPEGARVLDVGAGSAVLAIAAVLLGAAAARAVEMDPDAIDNALENTALNGVADAVRVEEALVDAAWLARERAAGWDVILANVLSSVLVPLLPAFRDALAPGGRLVLGGILVTEAEDVTAAARAAGLVVRATDVEGEWWCALLGTAAAGSGVTQGPA